MRTARWPGSMGGGHALLFGLRHPDVFGWVLGLSSSMLDPEDTGEGVLPAARKLPPAGPKPGFKRLWFACGKTDTLLAGNEKLAALLKEKGVPHAFEAIDGAHNWPQWRRYLVQVAPMLFSK